MRTPAAPRPALHGPESSLDAARSKLHVLAQSPTTLSLLLLILVGAAFSPLLSSGFIDFDDDLYVTANPHVRAGLSWAGVRWALQSTAVYNWHPLTWIAHMTNWQVYGANAWGHHLTSLILHGINTVLVFAVLKRLTSTLWPSFLVAALFGLHPLHVESVAWAAELKDVLSALFFLLTIWSYCRYVKGAASSNPYSVISYALAVMLYTLGLMAKPMLVSLPVVLLLLDFWPLQRWGVQGARGKPVDRASTSEPGWRLLAEKIPFVILAAVSCVVTFVVQKKNGALTEMAHLTLLARIENALLSYGRYLGKMFWPWDLTLFYPFPDHFSAVGVVFAVVCLSGITAVAIVWRDQFPWLLVGWAWFVITLVPVIGLIQAGGQAMADRYTYIPLIGIFIVVVWAARGLSARPSHNRGPERGHSCPQQRRQAPALDESPGPDCDPACCGQEYPRSGQGNSSKPANNLDYCSTEGGGENEGNQQIRTVPRPQPNTASVLALVSAALIVLCAGLTYRQAGFWRNSETLWSHALAITKDNFLAESNLGLEFQRQKRLAEAETQFRSAIRLRPSEAKARANLGNVLCREDRVGEGIVEFEAALRLDPNLAAVRHNLGIALCRSGRFAEGADQFQAVLKLRPDSAQTHFDLAMALVSCGRQPDALPHLQRALELRPGFVEAQRLLQALQRRSAQ